jgi:hypothetical protein
MEAVAHSPSFAKKAGVPQSVGKDFSNADKGKTFSRGGDMKESKAMVGKEMAFMKKKKAPASMIKHEKAEMMGMKKGGMKKMAAGGFTRSADGIATKGKTKATQIKMAKGGRACSRGIPWDVLQDTAWTTSRLRAVAGVGVALPAKLEML